MSRGKQISQSGYSRQNKVSLLRGGRNYFSLLKELIDNAHLSIHLQFYIFLDDETGKIIIEALKNAAQRGVAVFLQLDGYASQGIHKKSIHELKEAGVNFRWFEPLFRSRHFYFGRRLHHKVVVVDGIYTLVGGLNICNRYNDMPSAPAWLDMALYCEGEESLVVYNSCIEMWGDKNKVLAANRNLVEAFCEKIPEKEYVDLRLRKNDWVKRKSEVWKSYFDMFNNAEKSITIMCSYFLPGRVFRKRMAQATKRGVKIKVILAGISDIKMAKHAERFLYDWLLKNNIEIYEYQDTILHAKLATYDSKWVTVGSYNVNNISAYASLEMNMDVNDNAFAIHTENVLEDIITRHCKKITAENYASSTHFFRRIWQRFCYGFIDNVLNLFTFYFRQE